LIAAALLVTSGEAAALEEFAGKVTVIEATYMPNAISSIWMAEMPRAMQVVPYMGAVGRQQQDCICHVADGTDEREESEDLHE
jgi:hypothetical protein